jgi:hypothetical protein
VIHLAPQYGKVLMQHVQAETAFDMDATLATLTIDCLFEDMPSGGMPLEIHLRAVNAMCPLTIA